MISSQKRDLRRCYKQHPNLLQLGHERALVSGDGYQLEMHNLTYLKLSFITAYHKIQSP